MLATTIAALLFPVAIMAVPPQKPATRDDRCTPVSYTLTEYVREISPDYGFVSFNIQSAFTAGSPAKDTVETGVNCEADGVTIPASSNKCNARGEKLEDLVFYLRGKQDEGRYRFHHQWQCNNATWESIDDVDLPPLKCETDEEGKNGKTSRCTSKPILFKPQNIQKLEDLKKAADKAKAMKPTAKPADCSNPPKCNA